MADAASPYNSAPTTDEVTEVGVRQVRGRVDGAVPGISQLWRSVWEKFTSFLNYPKGQRFPRLAAEEGSRNDFWVSVGRSESDACHRSVELSRS